MSSVFISKVEIKNFRNFKEIEVDLSHKQVIIGENGVGKTNFLRAIQLIFDPSLSDKDRRLTNSDFHDSIEEPMKNGTIIEIAIEIQGYEKNNQLVAKFQDAVISDTPPTLRIVYKFEPIKDDEERVIDYQYQIYLGSGSQNYFNATHRSYLNIQVIKALRDVEREMKSLKKSPVFQLVDQYDIKEEELESIAKELQGAADLIMSLDEIIEVKHLIETKFKTLSGFQVDNTVNLSTFDIDPERLLHTLQVLLGEKKRPVSEISLGLCNILYITLMLLLIRDRTVPSIIKQDRYKELEGKDTDGLLKLFYVKNDKSNHILRSKASADEKYEALYSFMNKNYFPSQSFTILAVEEPEAHLHPVLQRLIYREVLQKSETSVIFTTHSTHLTSVAPINSIVHVRPDEDLESEVTSTSSILLDEGDSKDLERYLDARRGELFFGRGIILVEGIAEEYLVPKSAELLGHSLDSNRIVVCNINSTNFKPYVQLLNELQIPWCLITDGDYYEVEDGEKIFHRDETGADEFGYAGQEIVQRLLTDLNIVEDKDVPKEISDKEKLFEKFGCFVGEDTLEVDIMGEGGADADKVIKKVFSDLKPGGDKQQKNFEKLIDDAEYWSALNRIEMPGIGKGRFAQKLASNLIAEQIPDYIKDAIEYIIEQIKPNE
jgi:putative ATP-dependent endonuclease of the OLD family